jgi:hypothetical protein
MKKITATTTALMLGFVTAATITGASAQAMTRPAAAAAGGQSHQHTAVLSFVDRVDSTSNTDIDLGVPGLSAGDQQVFRDGLFQNGRRVGTAIGISEVVALTPTTLDAQIVSTAKLPAGQLMTQMAFSEILADGPPKVLHSGVTGGTGAYRNARGECVSEFIVNTEDATLTCTLIFAD